MAAFCSWDTFPWIINRERSGVLVNAGFEPVDVRRATRRAWPCSTSSSPTPRPPRTACATTRFTFAAALEHVRAARPRVLYLALGETDDWAHAGRYDHYLHSARRFDGFTRRLWDEMQAMDQYRGQTTFVITTDHGRGGGLTEWKSPRREDPGVREHLDRRPRPGHARPRRAHEDGDGHPEPGRGHGGRRPR